MTRALECSRVTVRYGDVTAVDELDLVVRTGETVALLGPSGSGKTSLLYAIAGLLSIDGGSIALASELVATPDHSLPPERRSVGLVFQNYALWPHMSALDIVAYPMRRAGVARAAARHRALGLLEKVGIGALADRRPAELSGGQQQRVGLARALAREARIYLFDEPTAHLDAVSKVTTLDEIDRRTAETGAAVIYATHDSAEALALADRVAIMRDGRIVQIDTAQAVYERPIDIDAATLTGSASVLRARMATDGSHVAVAGASIPVHTDVVDEAGEVDVIVRPEWVSLHGPLAGEVIDVRFTGPHTDYRIITSAGELNARVPGPPQWERGESTGATIERGWVPGG